MSEKNPPQQLPALTNSPAEQLPVPTDASPQRLPVPKYTEKSLRALLVRRLAGPALRVDIAEKQVNVSG